MCVLLEHERIGMKMMVYVEDGMGDILDMYLFTRKGYNEKLWLDVVPDVENYAEVLVDLQDSLRKLGYEEKKIVCVGLQDLLC